MLKNLKILGLITIVSATSFASEKESSSQSVGFNFSTEMNYLRNTYETIDQNVISMTVKLYENGDLYVESFDYSAIKYKDDFDDGNYEVDINFFNFYKEQIHRELGFETGTRYIDLKVAKVIKMDSVDDITYKIIARAQLNSHRHVRLNDSNQIKESETHYWDRDLPMAYGLEASAEYDLGDGYIKAEFTHYQNKSKLKSQENETPYDYSRVRNQLEFTYKPNKKKCHNYSVGVRLVDIDQSMPGSQSQINDKEIYARYNCHFDLEKIFLGEEDDISGDFIRF